MQGELASTITRQPLRIFSSIWQVLKENAETWNYSCARVRPEAKEMFMQL
jgi:hypothetical protein